MNAITVLLIYLARRYSFATKLASIKLTEASF